VFDCFVLLAALGKEAADVAEARQLAHAAYLHNLAPESSVAAARELVVAIDALSA
jgi:hypothetical protein